MMAQRHFNSSTTPAARAAEATQAAVPFTLPPPITPEARTSLARIPLRTDTAVHWWRFSTQSKEKRDGVDDDAASHADALNTALDQLLGSTRDVLSTEGVLGAGTDHAKSLSQSVLWSAEFTQDVSDDDSEGERRMTALWMFTLSAHTGQSNATNLTSPSHRVDRVSAGLHQAQVEATHGEFRLDEIYESKSYLEKANAISSVIPKTNVAPVLRHFLGALEEHYLSRWIRTRGHGNRGADNGAEYVRTAGQNAKPHEQGGKKDRSDADEEEEGALAADESDGKPTGKKAAGKAISSDAEFWPTHAVTQHKYRTVRFGRGVALFEHDANLSSLDRVAARMPMHMTLRCFADHLGHIYLESWAYAPPTSFCLTQLSDDDMENVEVMLCPIGERAKVLRHIGSLHAVRLDETDDEEKSMKDAHTLLFEMLSVRGVDASSLEDDWTLCLQGEQQFLWPTQLCLLYAPLWERDWRTQARAPSLVTSTIADVTSKVRSIVRETIFPNAPFDPHEAQEDDESASTDEDMNDDADEGVPGDDEMMDDDDDNEGEGESDEAVGAGDLASENAAKTEMSANAVNGSTQGLGIREDSAANKITSAAQSTESAGNEPNSAGAGNKDEEMDLWGTFGFGDQDEAPPMENLPRSRDGFDDVGFGGLVTEDDFSFFDDAADFGSVYPEDAEMEEVELPNDDEESSKVVSDLTALATEVPEPTEATGSAAEQTSMTSAFVPSQGSSLRQHDTDTASSSGATSMPMDPPSLPGFTPGSLSASSPAVGGMSVKTPRTPYSPTQDLTDANVTIEGEHSHIDHALYSASASQHFVHPHGVMGTGGGVTSFDAGFPSGEKALQHPHVKERQRQWMLHNRRDITSKYEQGKFAMPLLPALRKTNGAGKKQTDDDVRYSAGGMDSNQELPKRNRLGYRSGRQQGRHPDAKTGLSMQAWIMQQKGRLNMLRAEDELSEATVDGTMSERSSIADDDSDDDNDSMTSERESNWSIESVKQYAKDLATASAFLRSMTLSAGSTLQRQQEKVVKADCAQPSEWNGLISHLVDNPQLRAQLQRSCIVSNKARSITRQESAQLFALMKGFEHDSSLKEIFNAPAPAATVTKQEDSQANALFKAEKSLVQVIEPPRVLVGCQSSVVSVAPTALSYWEKLNLTAVSGAKDVVAFAIHVGDVNEAMENEIRTWFEAMERTFIMTGLGTHVMADQGILGLGTAKVKSMARFLASIANDEEQWSDTLHSLLSRLIEPLREGKFVVLYVVGTAAERFPSSMWTFARLERDLRHLATTRLNVAQELIVVRPCPWEHICPANAMSRSVYSDVRQIARSLYDSLQLAVGARYNDEPHLPRFRSSTMAVRLPSFTISSSWKINNGIDNYAGSASSSSATPSFGLDWNARSLNFLHRGTMLHVGFSVAAVVGQPTFVALIDEYGQGYHATAWRRAATMQQEINRMWDVIVEYSLRTRLLWRIVLCKYGALSVEEVTLWSGLLNNEDIRSRASSLDVTLACAEEDRPLAFVLPLTKSSASATGGEAARCTPSEVPASAKNSLRYFDASKAKYAIYPHIRIALPPSYGSDEDGRLDSEHEYKGAVLPLCSSLTISVPHSWNFETAVQQVSAVHEHDEKVTAAAGQSFWADNVPHQLWTHIVQVFSSDDHHADTQDGQTGKPNTKTATSMEARLTRITTNFQAMELIARERATLRGGDRLGTMHLPWHLAIVQTLRTVAPLAFDASEERSDGSRSAGGA